MGKSTAPDLCLFGLISLQEDFSQLRKTILVIVRRGLVRALRILFIHTIVKALFTQYLVFFITPGRVELSRVASTRRPIFNISLLALTADKPTSCSFSSLVIALYIISFHNYLPNKSVEHKRLSQRYFPVRYQMLRHGTRD